MRSEEIPDKDGEDDPYEQGDIDAVYKGRDGFVPYFFLFQYLEVIAVGTVGHGDVEF